MTATPAGSDPGLDAYRVRVHERRATAGVAPGPDELIGEAVLTEPRQIIASAVESLGLGGLLAARAEAHRLIEDDGIRYGAAEDGDQGRNWIVDPLPVVLSGAEWAGLEQALAQRAAVLDALLADLYGARTLLRRRVLPAEVVLGHPGFIRQADGVRLPGRRQLVLTATDLGRDADGSWVAFADRLGAPSGAGYAMATRRITTRVLAGVHRSTRLARLRPFFHTMTGALREIAPRGVDNPQVVLLSPGSGSETAYDQSFLATLLGFPFVESDDLTLRDGRVWIRATTRADQVDVVLRRVDADFVDPLELRPDSRLGLPGLVEATRRGTVTVANPIGSGVLENPALAAFLPAVAKALFGEELALPGVTTYWCGEESARRHVLARLDSLVLKPIARGPGALISTPGWQLSSAERADLRRRIEAAPWAWVGQDPLPMSTAPVVTPTGLEARRFVLRTFGVAHGDGYHFLPGGLGRVAPDESSYLVANAAGALAKDVWVLAGDESAPAWTDDRRLDLRPVSGGAEWAALAPRAAEGLFWIGRYAERAQTTARLLRVTDDLVEDHANWPDTPGEAAMRTLVGAVGAMTRSGRWLPEDAAPIDVVRRLVADEGVPGSVSYAVDRLVRSAQDVRDLLSSDIWRVLSRIERTLAEAQPEDVQLQPQLHRVLESMLAVHGVIAENMVRDESWGYLDGGVRLERAMLTVDLVRATLGLDLPPIIDGQVTEAVLESCDSIITHRRRIATGEGPAWPVHSAVELLLRDEGNPRSVAFCLARLTEDLRLLGASDLAGTAETLLADLRTIDTLDLVAGDRSGVGELCDRIGAVLRWLSERLTAAYFRRKPTQRELPVSWSTGRES